MKTTIYYASKYGATKSVANYIAEQLHAPCKAITKEQTIEGDCIILGASVYAGMLSKECKAFWNQHKSKLKDKQVYMFICSMNADTVPQVIKENLGHDASAMFKEIIAVGGKFDFSKMHFMERIIIKLINKKAKFASKIKKDMLIDQIQYQKVNELIEKVIAHV